MKSFAKAPPAHNGISYLVLILSYFPTLFNTLSAWARHLEDPTYTTTNQNLVSEPTIDTTVTLTLVTPSSSVNRSVPMDPADVSFSLEWRDVDSCHSDSDDDNPRDVQSSSSSDSEDIPPPFSSSVAPLPSHSCPSSLTSAFSALSVMQNDPTVNSSSENTPFIPRGYQLELYRRALDENIIICVETGAGKTLISALLIKHILERSETQLVSNLSSPRIVVFLVHRVTLVQQQAKVIENIIPRKFRVGCYHGDRGVDNWSPERWASNIKAHSVLVMTAQIFLNLLRHALIRMDQISLLIVDEAHHATKSHPYCRIFLEFYHCIPPTDHRPRVFGMTATPVKAKNASAKHANCLSAISELEATMDSTVVTVSMDAQNEVESLVPKPDEYVVSYIPSSETPQYCTEDGIDSDVLNDVLYNAPNYQNKSLSDLRRGMLPTTEMNLLARLNENIGFVAAKDIAIRFCEQRKIRPDDVLNVLLKQSEDVDPSHAAVRDKAFRLLDVLYFEYMRCKKELDAMESNSMDCSPQNGGKEGIGEKFRTIVFTHERVSALALSNLINEVFSKHECSQLTACPIVGTTSQALSIVRMSQSSMNKTIEAFRDGKFGILVATNVVEEGIDVPACRLVVTFDPPFSPAAYVQGRGRARKRGAHYISLVATGTEEDYNLLLRSREGARVMKDVSRGAYVTEKQRREMRAAIVKNVELKESMNREKILFSRTMPARVSAVDAVNLLIRYCNLKGQIMGVEDIEEPKFEVIADRKMWKATVTLDKRIPVDVGFCTEPQLSQQHAKRIAALDAYSKLYIVGEINDHLLPNKGKRSKRVLEVSAGPIGPVRSSRNGNESASSGGKKKKFAKKSPSSRIESIEEAQAHACVPNSTPIIRRGLRSFL